MGDPLREYLKGSLVGHESVGGNTEFIWDDSGTLMRRL